VLLVATPFYEYCENNKKQAQLFMSGIVKIKKEKLTNNYKKPLIENNID
jgi:hypothetical protein